MTDEDEIVIDPIGLLESRARWLTIEAAAWKTLTIAASLVLALLIAHRTLDFGGPLDLEATRACFVDDQGRARLVLGTGREGGASLEVRSPSGESRGQLESTFDGSARLTFVSGNEARLMWDVSSNDHATMQLMGRDRQTAGALHRSGGRASGLTVQGPYEQRRWKSGPDSPPAPTLDPEGPIVKDGQRRVPERLERPQAVVPVTPQ